MKWLLRYDLHEVQAEWVLPELPFEPWLVQPLSKQRLLICHPRCSFSPKDQKPNAAILDYEGKILTNLVLGDGILDIQVCDDIIWCAYFDEGIFGNRGWGEGSKSTPIGNTGLAAFDLTGKIIFKFQEPPHPDIDYEICDCYAMNVINNKEVWICPYTDFPLIKVGLDHKYQQWSTPPEISGNHSIALSWNRALLTNDYEKKFTRLIEFNNQGYSKLIKEFQVVDKTGNAFPLTVGRGADLYFTDPKYEEVYRLSIYDLDPYLLSS